MATLPMDIILTCILPKLPAKTLLRSKCVCKPFRDEISSHKFIKLQHLNAMASNDNRLLIVPGPNETIHIHDLDSPHSPPLVSHYPAPVFSVAVINSIVASCDSYLLIGSGYTQLNGLILFNPSTRTYRELPIIRVPYNTNILLYGMCHCVDEFNDDYKVVRFVEFGDEREVVVYSLRTDSWKLIECVPDGGETFVNHGNGYGSAVLIQNHLLHTIYFNGYIDDQRMTKIRCFDIKGERWANDVILADNILGENNVNDMTFNLGALDGQLCLSILDSEKRESTYDLWVMKYYGVKESWVKLISLSVANDFRDIYHPLAYSKESPHELLCIGGNSGKYFWHNLRNKEFTDVELDKNPTSYYSFACICKGSLLDFPGGKLMKAFSKKVKAEEDEDEDVYEVEDDDDFVIKYNYVNYLS